MEMTFGPWWGSYLWNNWKICPQFPWAIMVFFTLFYVLMVSLFIWCILQQDSHRTNKYFCCIQAITILVTEGGSEPPERISTWWGQIFPNFTLYSPPTTLPFYAIKCSVRKRTKNYKLNTQIKKLIFKVEKDFQTL